MQDPAKPSQNAAGYRKRDGQRQRRRQQQKQQGQRAKKTLAKLAKARRANEKKLQKIGFWERAVKIFKNHEGDTEKVARLIMADDLQQASDVDPVYRCTAKILGVPVAFLQNNDNLYDAAILLLNGEHVALQQRGSVLKMWVEAYPADNTARLKQDLAIYLFECVVATKASGFILAAFNLAWQNYHSLQSMHRAMYQSAAISATENTDTFEVQRPEHLLHCAQLFGLIAFFECTDNEIPKTFFSDIEKIMAAAVASCSAFERKLLTAQDAAEMIGLNNGYSRAQSGALVLVHLSKYYADKSRKEYQLALQCLDKLKGYMDYIKEQQPDAITTKPYQRVMRFEENMRTWLDRKIKAAERSKASNVVATDNAAVPSEEGRTESSSSSFG